ncbi:hypothetical protein N9R09_00215 [Porticoccaceae bacterium]|nr:hypothetical protein [Porticoccaceae bacterium]
MSKIIVLEPIRTSPVRSVIVVAYSDCHPFVDGVITNKNIAANASLNIIRDRE